jgi:hypothetical protein
MFKNDYLFNSAEFEPMRNPYTNTKNNDNNNKPGITLFKKKNLII